MKNRAVKIFVSIILALVICAVSFAAGFFTRKCTQGRELSSLEWAIKTINENYYFGGTDGTAAETAIDSFVEKYLDIYSDYYTAEEYQAVLNSNAGNKSGLGLSFSYYAGKGVYIATVVGNSPAYMCGLREGEWLKSGRISGGEEVIFNSADSFINLVNSSEGKEISLTSNEGAIYTVSKAEYTASYAYMCTSSTAWVFGDAAEGGLALYEKASERIPYLPKGCAYINLSQFYGSAADEFYVLVEKFNALGCGSLILDLRSNGGGYVNVMQNISGSFTDGEKPAMIARDKKGNEEVFTCAKVSAERRISKDTDVYVLANFGTASASEALIGAMVCYGALEYKNIFISEYSEEYLNAIAGSGQEKKNGRSYGKGIMQSPFVNDATGEVLKLTTAKIFWPDGKTSIHDTGLSTEMGCVTVPAAWEHTRPDEELKSVLKIISAR